jgi:hypothetical protein
LIFLEQPAMGYGDRPPAGSSTTVVAVIVVALVLVVGCIVLGVAGLIFFRVQRSEAQMVAVERDRAEAERARAEALAVEALIIQFVQSCGFEAAALQLVPATTKA